MLVLTNRAVCRPIYERALITLKKSWATLGRALKSKSAEILQVAMRTKGKEDLHKESLQIEL